MKLLVVDDAPLARAHLIRCLAGRPGIDVVGEAADGKSALDACAALLLVRDSLDDLASRYGVLGFHRIHRSELVQISAVTELTKDDEGGVAVLSDGQRARVSRREAPGLRDLLSA